MILEWNFICSARQKIDDVLMKLELQLKLHEGRTDSKTPAATEAAAESLAPLVRIFRTSSVGFLVCAFDRIGWIIGFYYEYFLHAN